MSLKWYSDPKPEQFKNPAAAFRLNALDDLLTSPDQPSADEIWWLAALEFGTNKDGSPRSLEEFMDWIPSQFIDQLFVPPEYYYPDSLLETETNSVTVVAQRALLNLINQVDSDAPVSMLDLGGVASPDMLRYFRDGPELNLRHIHEQLPEGAAVIAVIDSGIAVGHNLFRKRGSGTALDKTRVAFLWNMDGATTPSSPPQHWFRSGIDTLLALNMHEDHLDEATFYAQIGLIDWPRHGLNPVAHRISHGTHVMGLAAGLEPKDADLLDKRPIIAVQLPTNLVRDVSGANMSPAIKQALQFIRRAAKRFTIGLTSNRPPVVVNFSFGDFSGPHDGTGKMAEVLGKGFKSSSTNIRAVVLPSGNGNLSRCHAQVDLTARYPRADLNWRVQPEDLTVSSVEIWLPKSAAVPPVGSISLSVDHPAIAHSVTVECVPGAKAHLTAKDGTKIGHVSFTGPLHPTLRSRFTISIRPTAAADRIVALAPAGVWRLTLELGQSADDLRLEAWIARDETLPGFPDFGRQSYFDNSDYVRFYRPGVAVSPFDLPALIGKPLSYDPADPGLVRRAGTISGFACASAPAVLAGIVQPDRTIAAYSSGGPTDNPDRMGPDASATTDDSPVLAGVLSAGSNSGSLVAMRGTSVAAPQAVRWIAAELRPSKHDGRTLIRDMATSHPKLPEVRAGKGHMNVDPPFGSQRRPRPEA
ncbi:S8 family serine peptidase [Sedimentitalea nanhaiensis]|uniref:Subtilase family protein n=1 Tax=Sedimentitalea nanhaiensis TaxID=999627 RepID=A0A1I7E5S0_9RHOB|nr:S8 family serine peptidase [Sedimentitalea nanhaiensis]SFU19288.1 Subtilase family protein [Sedimentitalea nanhaiensis]